MTKSHVQESFLGFVFIVQERSGGNEMAAKINDWERDEIITGLLKALNSFLEIDPCERLRHFDEDTFFTMITRDLENDGIVEKVELTPDENRVLFVESERVLVYCPECLEWHESTREAIKELEEERKFDREGAVNDEEGVDS